MITRNKLNLTNMKEVKEFHKTQLKRFCFKKKSNNLSLWYCRTKKENGEYYHSKTINIGWMWKIWRKNKTKPQWGYRDNGANKHNNDTCFDATVSVGYLIFNYINWNLQEN